MNIRKNFLYINDEDIFEFNHYQTSHSDWKLSDTGFQIAYLLEKHIGNTKKYVDDNLQIISLVEKLEKLTAECNDFVIRIHEKCNLFGYSDANLLSLAIQNVNNRIKIEMNEKTQFRILHLIKKMYWKSSVETQNKYTTYSTLYIPELLCKLAIKNNDIDLMNGIMPLMFLYERDKIFTWSLSYGNLAIANSIIEVDRKKGRMKHQRWLEKNDAWPLIEPIKEELSNKCENEILASESGNNSLAALAQAIAQNFPLHEESSEFTFLFPFSNELNYKKVLDKISILNKLENMKIIQAKTKNKIGACLLFGESHFLSILSIIEQRANIIILADVVRKQWMHIEHMLVCLDKSETPEEFIQFFLDDNPILNENVGTKYFHRKADLDYLRSEIKAGGSIEDYNFLSSLEIFKECKQAAKKLIFVQIKLDLMNEIECQKLDALLSSHNATMTLCNLTNIHDYDRENKLSKSVALLLQSSPHCLVMYSTKSKCSERNDLYTHVSKGLVKYFISCLNNPFTPLTITSNETANLSKPISDTMLGVGLFSLKTTSLKLIASKKDNGESMLRP